MVKIEDEARWSINEQALVNNQLSIDGIRVDINNNTNWIDSLKAEAQEKGDVLRG
jgi:hypothetical protein